MAEERREDEDLFGAPIEEDGPSDAGSEPASSDPAEPVDPAPPPEDVPEAEVLGEGVPEDEPDEPLSERLKLNPPGLTTPMRGGLVLVGLIIFLVIALAIAALLVSSQNSTTTTTVTTAEVTAGSIRSTVTLLGVVVRQNTQNVPAPITGTLTQLQVRPGDAVAAGDNLATVTLSLSPSPSPSSTINGQTPTPSPSFSPITETVTSPIAGTVGKLTTAKGQFVVSGQTLLTVIPSRLDVIASVPQDQLYRFYTQPLSIQALIPKQAEPLDCAYQSIGANLPTTGATAVLQDEIDLRCVLPDGTSVFPGVRAKVVSVTAEVDDALTLPLTAVERGASGTAGVVWLVEKGKEPVRTNVTLGITDGTRIQIVSGLFAGQKVRNPAIPPSS